MPEARAIFLVGVLMVLYVLSFIDRQILGLLVEPIKREFGVSDKALGFVAGPAFSLFYALACLPIAHFVALGASWTPRPDWAYTARYAYGAQSANLAVYTDVGTVLHDEVQNKAEVSARYSGLGDWIEPQLTLFYAHDENYKYPVRFDTGTQQAIFTEATAHKTGLEISAHGHLGEDTRWHLGWTHMFYNPIVDDHGRTAPRNQAVLSLTHAWKVWEFQGALQYVDAFSSNFPTGGAYQPIGDFVRLDLSASHRVALGGRPITLRFYGRNVGDAHYSTQVGFTDPGTVWGASAQLDF